MSPLSVDVGELYRGLPISTFQPSARNFVTSFKQRGNTADPMTCVARPVRQVVSGVFVCQSRCRLKSLRELAPALSHLSLHQTLPALVPALTPTPGSHHSFPFWVRNVQKPARAH
jgi:hypothetical protein